MTKIIDFFKSIKIQLILLIILMAVVPGAILCSGILHSYEHRAITIRENEVLSQAQVMSNQIATSGFMKDPSADVDTLMTQIATLTNIYNGRMMIVNTDYRIIYDSYNLDENRTIISEEVVSTFSNGKVQMNYDQEAHYIEMTIPILDTSDEEDPELIGIMVFSVSTDNVALNVEYLYQIMLMIGVTLIIISVALGIFISIRIVKPFDRLSNELEAINFGYGEDKIQINDFTETKHISKNFNDMMARMKVMDDSRQEFVSNVSHELKTPLTSMKVLADSINSMPDAPIELYQEFMGDITNEIERETQIINDLLSLVKMDKSAADLNITTVSINDLLEQILKRLQPIADRQKVEVVLETFRPVTADIDEVKITLAITNLVENAIKYNSNEGEGWVHVSLNADHQYFYLKVEDNGMGIPEESLEHIYERFYRVDKSHSREIGGTGLGLAITRNSILMHKGAIKAHSTLGEGTTFDVRIPLNYIS